jgi:hypothetical protein
MNFFEMMLLAVTATLFMGNFACGSASQNLTKLSGQGPQIVSQGGRDCRSLINFDDLPNLTPIGNHYPGVSFSPGWTSWDSSANPTYPAHSIPHVAYTWETDNSIVWDVNLNVLSFYVNCDSSGSSMFEYFVYNDEGFNIASYSIGSTVMNHFVELTYPRMRRLEVRGLGNWTQQHTIDDLYYLPSEYLDCPAESVFSHPVDIANPEIDGYPSDVLSGYVMADFYSLPADQNIRSIRWWGFGTPTVEVNFDIVFYTNAGSEPGSLVRTYSVTAAYVPTGSVFFDLPLNEYNAELPENELRTEGWISIVGLSGVSLFYWANSTLGPALAVQSSNSSWVAKGDNMAVCLVPDSTAPTPTPTATLPIVPTWTPQPTGTPTSPPGEPTFTPSCPQTGCTIAMPSSEFGPGDPCSCTVTVCNLTGSVLNGYPLFVVLDVYGSYFFAPDFSGFAYYQMEFGSGITSVQVLPEFEWPAGAGTANDILWYAALTDPGISQLYGSWDSFGFGWHE